MSSLNKHWLSPLWTRPRADPAEDPQVDKTQPCPLPGRTSLVSTGMQTWAGPPFTYSGCRQVQAAVPGGDVVHGGRVQCQAPESWLVTEALEGAPSPLCGSQVTLEVTSAPRPQLPALSILLCGMGPTRSAQPGAAWVIKWRGVP